MRPFLTRSAWLLLLIALLSCGSQSTVKPEEFARLQEQNKNLQNEIKSRDDQIEALNEKLTSLSAELTNNDLQREAQVTAFSNLIINLQGEISSSNASIKMSENAVNVTLLDTIFFEAGSAEITEKGKSSLDKLFPVLKKVTGEMIRVEGYSDDIPITGSTKLKYPSNWELSTARASAVVRYLQEKGIDPNLMKATGYGKFNPVASNETAEGRAMNRRIAIVLVPPDKRAKFK